MASPARVAEQETDPANPARVADLEVDPASPARVATRVCPWMIARACHTVVERLARAAAEEVPANLARVVETRAHP